MNQSQSSVDRARLVGGRGWLRQLTGGRSERHGQSPLRKEKALSYVHSTSLTLPTAFTVPVVLAWGALKVFCPSWVY